MVAFQCNTFLRTKWHVRKKVVLLLYREITASFYLEYYKKKYLCQFGIDLVSMWFPQNFETVLVPFRQFTFISVQFRYDVRNRPSFPSDNQRTINTELAHLSIQRRMQVNLELLYCLHSNKHGVLKH